MVGVSLGVGAAADARLALEGILWAKVRAGRYAVPIGIRLVERAAANRMGAQSTCERTLVLAIIDQIVIRMKRACLEDLASYRA